MKIIIFILFCFLLIPNCISLDKSSIDTPYPIGFNIESDYTNKQVKKFDCSHTIGSCDYYLCVENYKNCGISGYLLEYGSKMCNRYNEMSHLLSSDGIKWKDGVMICLQVELDNFLTKKPNSTCKAIENTAFKSHAGCYTSPSHSICLLDDNDWSSIIRIVSVGVMGSPIKSFSQIIQVSYICSREISTDIIIFKGPLALAKAGKGAIEEWAEEFKQKIVNSLGLLKVFLIPWIDSEGDANKGFNERNDDIFIDIPILIFGGESEDDDIDSKEMKDQIKSLVNGLTYEEVYGNKWTNSKEIIEVKDCDNKCKKEILRKEPTEDEESSIFKILTINIYILIGSIIVLLALV